MKQSTPIILASASPRRMNLLRQIGIECAVHPSSIDERSVAIDAPDALVQRLAYLKADDVARQYERGIIIGADTIVVLNGEILGKPDSTEDARRMLRLLSGKTHTVYTGFCLIHRPSNQMMYDYETAEVTFRKMKIREIARYVASGSPMDKAGAYGIQDDFGAVFVSRINGDYYSVVGLPLSKLYTALEAFPA